MLTKMARLIIIVVQIVLQITINKGGKMKVTKLYEIIRAISQIDDMADVQFVSESYVLKDDMQKIKQTSYVTSETSKIEFVHIDFRDKGNRVTIKTT